MLFLQDAVIKPSYQYLLSFSLRVSVVISLFAEPLFRLTNQRLSCYQIRERFNVCQQIKPAELLLTASLSAREMMLKEQLRGGREETVMLILEMRFFW